MVLLDKSDPDYSDYMAIEMLKANKLEFASDDDYWEYVEKKVSERTKARDEKRQEDFDKLQEEFKIQREIDKATAKESAGDIDREWKEKMQEKNKEAWDDYEDKEQSLTNFWRVTFFQAKKERKRPPMSAGEYERRLNELKRIRIGKLTQQDPDDICRKCLGEKMNYNVMRECQACLGTGRYKVDRRSIIKTRQENRQAAWAASQEMWKLREEEKKKRIEKERKELEKARRLASGCFDEEGNETFC
jgi:hypothetical protein